MLSMSNNRFDKYVRTKFKNRGRDLSGLDCWGLVSIVFKEVYGVEIPDYSVSCTDFIAIDNKMNENRYLWERIESPIEPCLIAFHLNPFKNSIVNHVAVFIGQNRFIHALKQHGITITRLSHRYFYPKIEGYYVFK